MTSRRSRTRWLLHRLVLATGVVIGVATLTFALIHLAPGDPIYALAGDGGSPEYYADMRAKYGLDRPLVEQFSRYVKAVGITVHLDTLDFNAAVDRVYVKKDFDLGMASYCNGADPDIGVRRVYVSSNIGPLPFSNGAGYRNPRIDELFDDASRLADRDARRVRYVEIQRILAEDVPYFWIIDSEGLRAYRTAFTCFRLWTGAFVETVRPAGVR